MNKNTLTFKQKQEAVENIFKQYHRAKLKLYCLENMNYYPQVSTSIIRETKNHYNKSVAERLNSRIEDKDELKSLISSFEIIIKALSPDSQLIITNEFVEQRGDEWWVDYYSRATYYRLKTRALEEVLFYLNIT
ncbi:MAG: MG284/MPN403 family protein [Thomasclavelia sp.]|uniref:MG284/MPN403 family protein n=1 Tax=Thomasclavelia sp. TaxID=3025757 RepID=UPI00399F4A4F